MKREHKLFCIGNRDCAKGHSCIGGECIEDIVPDPPLVGNDPKDLNEEDEG